MWHDDFDKCRLNKVCMETFFTWNHDVQLITFGDLDSIIKVTAAYKEKRRNLGRQTISNSVTNF